MPDRSFYDGLPPAEQLTKFNQHHHDHFTRHTSKYESQMLDKMADLLSDSPSGPAPSATGGGGRSALIWGGVIVVGTAAAVIGRRLDRNRRHDTVGGVHSVVAMEERRSKPDVESSSDSADPRSDADSQVQDGPGPSEGASSERPTNIREEPEGD